MSFLILSFFLSAPHIQSYDNKINSLLLIHRLGFVYRCYRGVSENEH